MVSGNARLSPTSKFAPVTVQHRSIVTNDCPSRVQRRVLLFFLLLQDLVLRGDRPGESHGQKHVDAVCLGLEDVWSYCLFFPIARLSIKNQTGGPRLYSTPIYLHSEAFVDDKHILGCDHTFEVRFESLGVLAETTCNSLVKVPYKNDGAIFG